MPLTKPVDLVCEDVRVGIGFTMHDGERQVIVWVDRGALLVLAEKVTGRNERAAFDRNRDMLETIASANYDAGIIEPNGSTIIRRADVEGLG